MSYDIILVYPETGEKGKRKALMPPYSILSLPSFLRDEYRVFLYDQRVQAKEELEEVVRASNPVLVGFSTMSGIQIDNALKIAREIRQVLPSVPFVWGGVHPSILPEQTILHPLVDIIVRGEGEKKLAQLTHALKYHKDLTIVPGITFKEDGKVFSTRDGSFMTNLDDVNYAWDLLPPEKYIYEWKGKRIFGLLTARGCPFRCAFCSNPVIWKRRWRGWSAERVIKEVEWLNRKCKLDVIFCCDDYFLSKSLRAQQIVEKIKTLGLGWTTGGVRANQVTEDLVNILKKNNCLELYVGAESGSQRVLNTMKKDIRVSHIIKTTELCRQFKIPLSFSWLFGTPGETKDDVLLTLDLIDKLNSITDCGHMPNLYCPSPGTEMFKLAIDSGYRAPTSFEKWGKTKFEYHVGVKAPYLAKSANWYRAVYLSVYFVHYKRYGRSVAYQSPLTSLIKSIEKFRWEHRFFSLPIDGYLLKYIR